MFNEKDPPGWIAWSDSISLYTIPDKTKSTFQPWDPSSKDAVAALRELATDPSYWEQLGVYYSEENRETNIIQDNVSCVKSICMPPSFIYPAVFTLVVSLVQLLEDEPFEALRPTMETMIADRDQDTQRAAAEFLAGVLGGSLSLLVATISLDFSFRFETLARP